MHKEHKENQMDKEHILAEIRRIALENDGKAPGMEKFKTVTGITRRIWSPKYWLRWSDALIEAGFQANTLSEPHDEDTLVLKYISLIRDLGRFPVDIELRRRRQDDPTFPGHNAFRKLGTKNQRIATILKYCDKNDGFNDVKTICSKIHKKTVETTSEADLSPDKKIGYVYLIRHGKRNEYKIGKTNNPIRREGEIRLELPEKIQPIHYIETDDPSGIERYWHNRFADKRKEGEWFVLTKSDVQSFKRWKKIN
jgi:Meiotically up-regulated gene 113